MSDLRHHSVYILDKKDLKHKKCVADTRNGLDTPTAIAIVNVNFKIRFEQQINNTCIYSSKANAHVQKEIIQLAMSGIICRNRYTNKQ